MESKAFEYLGLSEKAAKVYLAVLSLGTSSVQQIARKSGLKRPTTYLYVEELLHDGLLEKYPSGKKEFFIAKDPSIIEQRAERQTAEVKSLLSTLRHLQMETPGRPKVTVMEGRKALEEVYREICQANQIRFWSDLRAVEEHFLGMFTKIAESVEKNEIRTREIISDTIEARKSSKRYAVTAGKTYSSRIATKAGIQNDSAIYGDTVALFRLHKNNLFVVLIKEPTVAETMKTLFDMAWESATQFIGK